MKTNIRVVETPDEFGGFTYELAKMTYDDEGYLTDVTRIERFDTHAALLAFTDQVYKATLHANVYHDPERGVYEL